MAKRRIKWKSRDNNPKKKNYRNDESDSDSDEEEEDEVWRDNNHIFFYADVDSKSIAKLNRFISTLLNEISLIGLLK